MIIRDAAEADLPAIIEIYNAATATRSSTALIPISCMASSAISRSGENSSVIAAIGILGVI